MKTRVLVALLLAVTASLFWWSGRDEGDAPDGRAASARGEARGGSPARPRDRLARSRLEAASAASISPASAPVDDGSGDAGAEEAGEPPGEPPAAPPPDAAAAVPSPAASAAALRQHLDASFEEQAADPGWSGAARLSVARTFAALMPPTSTMKSVECRATLCRMEMVYDDLAQVQAFMSRLGPEALPWNGTLFSTPIGDPSVSPVTFVAFLSRDGHQLAVD